MMLPYGDLITRLIHAHDIVIPPNEEIMKLDRFNIINRNLLRRLRCIVMNHVWTRLHKRTNPHPLESELEIPIHRGGQSFPTSPFEATPLIDLAPSSSTDSIATRLDRIELRQDQILTKIQYIHAKFDTLFRHLRLPPPE